MFKKTIDSKTVQGVLAELRRERAEILRRIEELLRALRRDQSGLKVAPPASGRKGGEEGDAVE